ncbi:unnamed protein product [Hymenolepis diminuta]|uniref:Uncharacterized protein n=1 Tax=Hymenolepis diminuta TaxID=6216 RepID=A0A564YW84_HYMDI|nr:unnamed protein product [Hymenolepis diminuta]
MSTLSIPPFLIPYNCSWRSGVREMYIHYGFSNKIKPWFSLDASVVFSKLNLQIASRRLMDGFG